MIHSLYLKAAQASKIADNLQIADPKMTREEAVKRAMKIQKDMGN